MDRRTFFADVVKANFEYLRTLNVLTLLRRAVRTSRTSSAIGFAAGYFLRGVSMSGSRTRFSKCSVSGSPYFVDV